ncbi:MAG: OB-fold nucleic acid binding domain-containing protein [Desulfurococcaceae archaeon]
MRGWTHYLSGLVMSTFFPNLLADLSMGNPLPVISGLYGYLPDFLDFKFKRFLWKRDIVIDPSPQDPVTKVSPRRILIKDLNQNERWKLYYIEGTVVSIKEHVNGRIEFTLKDETGSIDVIAVNEDYNRFVKIYSEIKPGLRIRIPGYLDYDEQGRAYWNVADAPHPQYIANLIAKAIDTAYETNRLITVKIYNIRMKADVYRRFLIHYDSRNRVIRVYMGPLVSTGGLPFEGTDTPEYRRIGEAKTKYPFRKVYPRPTVIDAFSGPEIGFEKRINGNESIVEEVFIPWHRGFSHSFTAGFLIALPLLLILKLINYVNYFELTIACMLGYWMHVIEDQLGFMGSVLLPPLTKKRIPGLMLGPRIYGLMNFAASFLMIGLAVWNINRFTPLLSPNTPKPIPLSDSLTLIILISPSIAIFTAGAVDRILYSRKLKELEKEKEAEEKLEEMEEIGGF